MNELKKYLFVGIIGLSSIIFWYMSQPATQVVKAEQEGERLSLPSVILVEGFDVNKIKRDPFEPGESVPAAPEGGVSAGSETVKVPYIRVDGIMFGDKDKSVNISGKVYSEGDVYKGARINKILPDKVVFEFKGKIIEKSMSVPDFGIFKK